MMSDVLILAQQWLNWFDVTREALWELYLWFLQFVRTGRVAWVLLIVAVIILYQRFKKK